MNSSLTGRLAAAASLAVLCLAPARADAPGVLWQTTSQMVMEGMPFSPPPTSLKVCTPAVWTQPPPGGDRTCVNSNFQRIGTTKVTWTVQCSGEMPMTGTGEINFKPNGDYTGVILANADGMNMKIMLTGKKLGTCDNPTG